MYKLSHSDWTEDASDKEILWHTYKAAQRFNCTVTIETMCGINGWPEVTFRGEREDLKKLAAEYYDMDEDEFEEFVEVDNK